MTTATFRQFILTAALALTAFTTQAADAAEAANPPRLGASMKANANIASDSTGTNTNGTNGLHSASAGKTGLTREQVMEDLKRYQREHANPSYAELVFLR